MARQPRRRTCAAVDRLDGLTPPAAISAHDAVLQRTGQHKTGKVASTAT